ncbi:MAG TPA: hypothetical protein VL651_16815 [Bacteroidia bacterium]|jgi:hypothetical protein|nr:hypothetical protein [Bacteroidia bacterium]
MSRTFIFISVIFLISSCNKEFPEGGKHAGCDQRLIGDWSLTQFSVNGADSLSILDPRITAENALHVYLHHTNGTIGAGVPMLSVGDRYGYTINYLNSGTRMEFYNVSVVTDWPFQIPPNDWQILELTKTEVKLKISFTKEYVMVWNKK